MVIIEGSSTTHSTLLNTTAAITRDATSLNIVSRSVSRPLFHAKKPSIAMVNVKIVKAKMKHNLSGKAEFTFIAQIFVGVTDATAHVDLKLTRNGDRDMIL